jgi:hypothetical protein
MWSVGCLLWEVASGRVLFAGDGECHIKNKVDEMFPALGPSKVSWRGGGELGR